jgi:hypothetical protein
MPSSESAPVGPATGGSGRARYLVGSSDSVLLERVVADLRHDDGITIDRVLNTATGVGGVVIEATADQVRRLQGQYGSGLVVEEDQELGMS